MKDEEILNNVIQKANKFKQSNENISSFIQSKTGQKFYVLTLEQLNHLGKKPFYVEEKFKEYEDSRMKDKHKILPDQILDLSDLIKWQVFKFKWRFKYHKWKYRNIKVLM